MAVRKMKVRSTKMQALENLWRERCRSISEYLLQYVTFVWHTLRRPLSSVSSVMRSQKSQQSLKLGSSQSAGEFQPHQTQDVNSPKMCGDDIYICLDCY